MIDDKIYEAWYLFHVYPPSHVITKMSSILLLI